MSERERISEVLDAIENGMCKIAETRDIWQNDLIYALCEGERILLTARLKELNHKPAVSYASNSILRAYVSDYVARKKSRIRRIISDV